MSRDYKQAPAKPSGLPPNTASLISGVMIGLVLGLAIALGVAWYINKMPNPFHTRDTSAVPAGATPANGIAGVPVAGGNAAASATAAPPDAGGKGAAGTSAGTQTAAAAATDKPRFDFYKILPGPEEPISDQQLQEAQRNGNAANAHDQYYLQVGAFQNAPEADSLKAKLALMGIDSGIQMIVTPDKGTWHRVRTGPYASIQDLNAARAMLKQNGLDTTLVRVPAAPDKH